MFLSVRQTSFIFSRADSFTRHCSRIYNRQTNLLVSLTFLHPRGLVLYVSKEGTMETINIWCLLIASFVSRPINFTRFRYTVTVISTQIWIRTQSLIRLLSYERTTTARMLVVRIKTPFQRKEDLDGQEADPCRTCVTESPKEAWDWIGTVINLLECTQNHFVSDIFIILFCCSTLSLEEWIQQY